MFERPKKTSTHHSKEYVAMVDRLIRRNGIKMQSDFWRTFKRLGEEYQIGDLDVERSLELQKKHQIEPRACYYNAAMLAMKMPSVYDYMEGIATCIIPTEHAWLVDRTQNIIVDPTWILMHQRARKAERKIADYFGVRVPISMVREVVLKQEMSGPMLWLLMDQLKDVKRQRRYTE